MIDIYLITNKINGKRYIGKTKKSYQERFKEHCLSYNHGCRTYIACAIHKYGKDNFSIQLIDKVKDDTWKYWENYYIKKYNSHYTQGGYNITWGGDSNPMDIPLVREKHLEKCQSQEFIEKQRKKSLGKLHSDKTKELCRQRTLANLDVCIAGFKKYNESRKTKVGMIENDVIIKEFDSLSAACAYLGCNRKSYTSCIKRTADKFNKNGERAKFLGYSWTLL